MMHAQTKQALFQNHEHEIVFVRQLLSKIVNSTVLLARTLARKSYLHIPF